MNYKSTRGKASVKTAAGAIIQGIAEDKGLYVPESFPIIREKWEELSKKSYRKLALTVLAPYLSDYSEEELKRCIEGAYKDKFDGQDTASLVKVCKAQFLELYHGPTAAFKDMALALMPYLMSEALAKEKEDKTVCILVSTSGDTGMAALKGFEDVPGICIVVFFPHGAVSPVQEAQMRRAGGSNTRVYSIYGNFDDAQRAQKALLNDAEFAREAERMGYRFSAANSMNPGRLLPQVVYYVWAYAQMVRRGEVKAGEPVNISVPSGNFGNILGAYYAKRMGLPVGRLICASNKNKILTDFLRSGVYDTRREFYVTNAPSMDILVSSNLERLLYHLSGEDATEVSRLMGELSEKGVYEVNRQVKEGLGLFYGGFAQEEEIIEAIGRVYKEEGYLMDTHTAVAFKVWEDYKKESGDETPAIIASTASPYKFAASVCEAIGIERGNSEFEALRSLEKAGAGGIPRGLKDLESMEIRHPGVIKKEDIKDTVRKILEGRI